MSELFETLDDAVITEYRIMCFADGCDNDVVDTDKDNVVMMAEHEGYVVKDDESFCAEHA